MDDGPIARRYLASEYTHCAAWEAFLKVMAVRDLSRLGRGSLAVVRARGVEDDDCDDLRDGRTLRNNKELL